MGRPSSASGGLTQTGAHRVTVASALRPNECWRTEEKAPPPAAQEEGHPPTRDVIAARRYKQFIIAQIALGRDNFKFYMQQEPSALASAALISCQNATRAKTASAAAQQ